jgi:hypothetical protein
VRSSCNLHPLPTGFYINGWLNASELRGHSGQILGVTHEQITVGYKMPDQIGDYSTFGSRVKINQHIAAENSVEWTFMKLGLLIQIQLSEIDHLLNFDFHFHLALPLRNSA